MNARPRLEEQSRRDGMVGPVSRRSVSSGEELKHLEILRDERRGRLGQDGAVW